MKRVVAMIGGLLMTLIVYVVIWFFVRNILEGLAGVMQVAGHSLVALVAISAGVSSYRASLAEPKRRRLKRRSETG